jgi:hypothetical protein
MSQPADLSPEERAQILEIQDRLIELFVDRGEAVDSGNRSRADALQDEIDDLLRQRDDIRMWAAST